MAKKAKRKERQLKAQNHYTRNDFEVRPVTKEKSSFYGNIILTGCHRKKLSWRW